MGEAGVILIRIDSNLASRSTFGEKALNFLVQVTFNIFMIFKIFGCGDPNDWTYWTGLD